MEKPFKRKYLVEKEKKKKVAILMHVTEAGKTPCPKGGGQAELPHVRGQGGAAERRYPASEVRGSDERRYPASEVGGGGREEIPHAPKPEARGDGREELPNAPMPEARGNGQEQQPHA